MPDGQKVMKVGLIIAVIAIVLRIVLEQAGAPGTINNIFGVAWLYFILPVFFALHITSTGRSAPFKTLLKNVFVFAVYTRIMVMVTYMLAYQLRWEAPRFSTGMGGNVGNNVSPLNGFLLIPVRNAAIWIIFATIVGMIVGGIVLLFTRKKAIPPRAA